MPPGNGYSAGQSEGQCIMDWMEKNAMHCSSRVALVSVGRRWKNGVQGVHIPCVYLRNCMVLLVAHCCTVSRTLCYTGHHLWMDVDCSTDGQLYLGLLCVVRVPSALIVPIVQCLGLHAPSCEGSSLWCKDASIFPLPTPCTTCPLPAATAATMPRSCNSNASVEPPCAYQWADHRRRGWAMADGAWLLAPPPNSLRRPLVARRGEEMGSK